MRHKRTKAEIAVVKAAALDLLQRGYSASATARELNVTNKSLYDWFGEWLRARPKVEWTCEHFDDIALMLKAGNTYPEIQEAFGVTHHQIARVSKLVGGAPKKYGNQHTGLFLSQEEYEAEQAKKRELEQVARDMRNRERARVRNAKECETAAARFIKESTMFNRGRQLEMHFCESCGVLVGYNRKRCAKCQAAIERRRSNAKKDRRRLAAFTNESASITVRALFERDGGICWLCGKPCDINADTNANEYPSIDHVVPISHCGLDKWDNVKLAHRICNSLRQDNSPTNFLQ